MASKRKPLEDARRRVKEKLNAIDEQKEFIQNSVDQLTSGVKQAANSLLTEGHKTKFFQKYRAVSQELEKCLDDLLLISATISSLEDEEEGESDEESEDDEKPPDEISHTTSKEDRKPITNDSNREEINQGESLPADEKPSIISSPTDCAKTRAVNTYPVSNATSAFPNDVKTDTNFERKVDKIPATAQEARDLIEFDPLSSVARINETVSASSYPSSGILKETTEGSIHTLKDSKGSVLPITGQTEKHATISFDLINIDQSYLTETSSLPSVCEKDAVKQFDDISDLSNVSERLHQPKVCKKDPAKNKEFDSADDQSGKKIAVEKSQDPRLYVNDPSKSSNLSNVREKHPGKNKQFDNGKDQEGKEIAVEKSKDSSAYVNDLFMASPAMDMASESVAVEGSSRRSSVNEIKENILELNMSAETENEPSSPSAIRLQRIGFCAYKSHEEKSDGVLCERAVDLLSNKGEMDSVLHVQEGSSKRKADLGLDERVIDGALFENAVDLLSNKGKVDHASHEKKASHEIGADLVSRKRKADFSSHENEAHSRPCESVAYPMSYKSKVNHASHENETSHEVGADHVLPKIDSRSPENEAYSWACESVVNPASDQAVPVSSASTNESYSAPSRSVAHVSSHKGEVDPMSYKNEESYSPSRRSITNSASHDADQALEKNKAYSLSRENMTDPSSYKAEGFPTSRKNKAYSASHKSVADTMSYKGKGYSTSHENEAYTPSRKRVADPTSHKGETDSEIVDDCGKTEMKVRSVELPQTTSTTANIPQETTHRETFNACGEGEKKVEAVKPSRTTGTSVRAAGHEHVMTFISSTSAEYKHGTWTWDGKSLTKSTESESEKATELTEKAPTSPISSTGEVIEEASSETTTCKITDVKGLHIPVFEIPDDKCMKVTVKEIVSLGEFWIQKANDDLDLMMEKMCFHFSKRAKTGDKGGLTKLPTVGHVCCARYTGDDVWYRALITAVSHEDSCVQVLYVDEGNSESLPLSRLRELDENFARLPCQALRVQLRGLELREDVNVDEVNDWFRRHVSGETLEAIVNGNEANITPVPLDLYIRPHAPRSPTSDHGCQKLEFNILEILIREGSAKRGLPPETSSDPSPPSSPSDQLVKSESVLSSSVTSGFHETVSPTLEVEETEVYSPTSGCHSDGVISRVPAPVIPVDSDGSVYMLVSHVVNPGEFYVHFISSEAGMLDELMADMNQAYKDLESEDYDSFSPRVGDFCCAKFSADGNWYRGLVLQVRVGESGEKCSSTTVEVFYIDFGNIEEVTVEDLRELLPQFMVMPAQVVRCSLADVNPSVKQAMMDNDVFDDSMSSEQDDDSKGRLSRQRSHKNKVLRHIKAIPIAAGDEDEFSGDEFPTLVMDPPEFEHNDRLRSSISDDIAKSHQGPLSDTAVELFEKIWPGVEHKSLKPNWSEKAIEYFKSLTAEARKLVGYVVPWDYEMLNRIVNYSQGEESSLPNLGPVLRLNLYDVSDIYDVFINAAMVRAQYASSSSIKDDQGITANAVPVIPEEASCTLTEANSSEEVETLQEDLHVVRVNQRELFDLTETSEDSKSTPPSLDPSLPTTPISPTSKLLDAWNPMSNDQQEFRNAYNVKTDNLDVAITGYEEDRGKICRFYHTRYGCYRGSKCPDKHIEKDVSDQVLMIYGSPAKSLKLPDIGAWVLVKITAIYDPSHFWVQLPYGIENLKIQLIKGRSGKETSGDENLKEFNNLMKQMSEFYSKTLRRERSLVPPVQGELVVVRSDRDNRWYRGQVCEEEKGGKYKILILDYGITEWIDRSNICPTMPQFLHLPFQSVECYLANISPKSPDWSEDARQYFKSLIENEFNNLLVCQILSIGINKTMVVNLFETTETGESRSVTEELIKSGFAEEAKFKILQPVDLKSLADKSIVSHPG